MLRRGPGSSIRGPWICGLFVIGSPRTIVLVVDGLVAVDHEEPLLLPLDSDLEGLGLEIFESEGTA